MKTNKITTEVRRGISLILVFGMVFSGVALPTAFGEDYNGIISHYALCAQMEGATGPCGGPIVHEKPFEADAPEPQPEVYTYQFARAPEPNHIEFLLNDKALYKFEGERPVAEPDFVELDAVMPLPNFRDVHLDEQEPLSLFLLNDKELEVKLPGPLPEPKPPVPSIIAKMPLLEEGQPLRRKEDFWYDNRQKPGASTEVTLVEDPSSKEISPTYCSHGQAGISPCPPEISDVVVSHPPENPQKPRASFVAVIEKVVTEEKPKVDPKETRRNKLQRYHLMKQLDQKNNQITHSSDDPKVISRPRVRPDDRLRHGASLHVSRRVN